MSRGLWSVTGDRVLRSPGPRAQPESTVLEHRTAAESRTEWAPGPSPAVHGVVNPVTMQATTPTMLGTDKVAGGGRGAGWACQLRWVLR